MSRSKKLYSRTPAVLACCFCLSFRALPPASVSPTFSLGVCNVPCNAEICFRFSFHTFPPASASPLFATCHATQKSASALPFTCFRALPPASATP